MASMILRWCFDVLTKNLNSHLLTCHRLPITPRQSPTPSNRRIPSNTSSTRGRRKMKVRNGRQVYLPDTFDWLTLLFVYFCHTRWHILLNAPRTQPTPLPTHQSLRIHQRQGVDEIWRQDVQEKWVGEVRAPVVCLFALISISPPLVDCCCCVNKQHTTINRLKERSHTQQ